MTTAVIAAAAVMVGIVVADEPKAIERGAEQAERTVQIKRAVPAGRAALTMRQRLRKAGRAEAAFERHAEDPLSGEPEVHAGTLALELPDRIMLHFKSTGERLALRGDGGEWLQPELEQMLVLSSEHLGAARLWWGFLLAEDATVVERKLADRRYRLIVDLDGEVVDSATVWLDRASLPERLVFRDDSGLEVSYHFEPWAFKRGRGEKAFRLEAPESFEVVRLP